MHGLPLYLIALVALLFLSASFSGSEAALFSLSRTRLRAFGDRSPRGKQVATLLEQPRKLLVTILLGNLIVNISATSAATAVCLRLFGERGLVIAFLLMSTVIIAFGEILPKAIALRWAERYASVIVVPLRAFHTALLPIRAPLSAFSEAVVEGLRRWIGQPKRSFTWQELVTALRIARREGGIGEFEFELIGNALSFRNKIVREIMTPSIDVVSMSVRASRGDLISRFDETGHSRMPIREDTGDEVVGVLHIKDLVKRDAASDESDLRKRLREPYFVRETTPISALYNNMQRDNLHIALVLDEYASFVGLVTIEDILEELVGEIRDVRDPRTESFMRVDEGEIIVNGTMELNEFNEVFGVLLDDDEHETIAGYVIGLTGRIPIEGEVVEADGLRFQVLSAQPNRIRKMKVERI